MISKRSLIGVAALFALAATGACGSDDSAPPSTPGAGAPAAHAGAGGAPASGGGGATSAGAPAAGAPTAGAPAAGAGGSATAGAGGAVTAGAGGASGGTSGGAGGASAGAGGGSAGGTSTATFAKVSQLLSTSCAGANCHAAASQQADFLTATGLYTRLTTPLTDAQHCVGETLVTPGDASKSFLLKIIQGTGGKTANHSTCKNNNGTEDIVRMPDDCPGQRPCLTADQIKLVSDWVAAGAPM